MKIETKYNIGEKIWVIYEDKGEIKVYDALITYITIEEDRIFYGTDIGLAEFSEEDVILYDEKEKLMNKIFEIMEEIHRKEEEL